MATQLNEPVEVQARIYRGRSEPTVLVWRGRTYQLIEVQRLETRRKKAREHVEMFSAAIVDIRKIKLMYDHQKKIWTLLSIDEPHASGNQRTD